jgi:hypothetical protein
MGLIHSRASKKRAKAEAELLREQAKQVRAERQAQDRAVRAERAEAAADLPAWRQPTLGAAIAAARRNRHGDGEGAEPGP